MPVFYVNQLNALTCNAKIYCTMISLYFHECILITSLKIIHPRFVFYCNQIYMYLYFVAINKNASLFLFLGLTSNKITSIITLLLQRFHSLMYYMYANVNTMHSTLDTAADTGYTKHTSDGFIIFSVQPLSLSDGSCKRW